jgi:hypothetical protein
VSISKNTDPFVNAMKAWSKFFISLTERDKKMIDGVMSGRCRKRVCTESNVPYGTFQRKLKRWEERLGLRTSEQFLMVWRFMRRAETIDTTMQDEPTLIRIATNVARGSSNIGSSMHR